MLVGLFLRNFKVYNGLNFIPISFGDYFTAYFGQNGAGKSSVLEALDTYFNNSEWIINRKKSDSSQKYSERSYILPVFLIPFTELSQATERERSLYDLCKKLSTYFWNINDTSSTSQEIKYFFDYRDKLKSSYPENDYCLLLLGKLYLAEDHLPYFGAFQNEPEFLSIFSIEASKEEDLDKQKEENDNNIFDYFEDINIIKYITNLYNYIYLPSDIDVETFTKLENDAMQDLLRKNVKDAIADSITSEMMETINTNLSEYVSEVSSKLENYTYAQKKGADREIKKTDLVNRIIRAYFTNKVLSKKGNITIPVNQLSSGEKRKALIDVTVTLLENSEQDKKVILGIDEPEISLHISACFEQFEKLRGLSLRKTQVLVTTHWYGFFPIVGNGLACCITDSIPQENVSNKKIISIFSLEHYLEEINVRKTEESKQKKPNYQNNDPYKDTLHTLPGDIFLKSKHDLVQSIVLSMRGDNSYNYLIVEGYSDRIYFDKYLKPYVSSNNLRILPVGGRDLVISLMEYLYLSMETIQDTISTKIVGIIDNDSKQPNMHYYKDTSNLKLRRIRFDSKKKDIILEKPDSSESENVTAIEDILEPDIFLKTIKEITKDEYQEVREFFNDENLNAEAKCSWDVVDYKTSQRSKLKEFFGNKFIKTQFSKMYVVNDVSINNCSTMKEIVHLFNFPIKTDVEKTIPLDIKTEINNYNTENIYQSNTEESQESENKKPGFVVHKKSSGDIEKKRVVIVKSTNNSSVENAENGNKKRVVVVRKKNEI